MFGAILIFHDLNWLTMPRRLCNSFLQVGSLRRANALRDSSVALNSTPVSLQVTFNPATSKLLAISNFFRLMVAWFFPISGVGHTDGESAEGMFLLTPRYHQLCIGLQVDH